MKYLLLTGLLAGMMNIALAQKNPYFLIAHRGGVVDDKRPENSLPALEKAIERGYGQIEMDMRLTKDSVLIIQHDRNFKRYFGVDANVSDLTWAEISQLKSNAGTKVITLEEAFQHCQGKIRVMLDNKIEGLDTALFGRVVALLRKYELLDHAIMIGTDESTPYFTGKVKLSCTRKQLEVNSAQPGYKPEYYYLFGGVNSMTAADVKWAQKNNIMVVGAVNLFSYKQADKRIADGKKDIETLKKWGVKRFQIDSDFDSVFFSKK